MVISWCDVVVRHGLLCLWGVCTWSVEELSRREQEQIRIGVLGLVWFGFLSVLMTLSFLIKA